MSRLIGINVVVFIAFLLVKFVFWIMAGTAVYETIVRFFMLPARLDVLMFQPFSVVTYGFLHEDPWHILFNMLFLYYFGSLIEEYIGGKKLVAMYVLGAVAGGVLFLLAYNLLPRMEGQNAYLIGASGAVYAIVVGAATLLPHYTFNLILLGPVRIVWIAAFYIVLSIFNVMQDQGGNWAHLAGAALGFFYIKGLRSGTDLGKPVTWVLDTVGSWFAPRPRFTVTRGEQRRSPVGSTYSTGTRTQKASYTNQVSTAGKPTPDEIDRILDKISRKGVDSLTDAEKRTLQQAGEDT